MSAHETQIFLASRQRSGPARWRLAGRLAAALPDVRGRDRLLVLVRGRSTSTGPISGRLTNGLLFDFPDSSDPAIGGLIHLQYVEPALAPVLAACLPRGGCFFDVGANIGLYSLWASVLTGPTGCVAAIEPVPTTQVLLQRFLSSNDVSNVRVLPFAAGATQATVQMRFDPRDSAQADVVEPSSGASLAVQMRTLDDVTEGLPPPQLVKIDVEGHELGVLQGGATTWERDHPVIVLEAIPSHLARAGTSYTEVCAFLAGYGYRLFNLTPRGLMPTVRDRPTANVLALCDRYAEHRRAHSRLLATRFARNQTV